MMKKIYSAPILECLAFYSTTAIGTEVEEPEKDSKLWNDGELSWS